MLSIDDLFKGRQFDREIIILWVRWYLRFKLSFRDLVEIMAERGVSLAHTTIMRWITRYVPDFEKRWNRPRRGHGRIGRYGASKSVAKRLFLGISEGRLQHNTAIVLDLLDHLVRRHFLD